MLYRIAIYRIENGKRVFDHYASDEEMENLKVSPDGKVWHYQIEEFIINPITGLPVYRIINTDFSDTHEVEWGTILKDYNLKLYENDLIEFDGNVMTIALTDYGFCGKYIENGIEMAYTLRSGVRTILGNIHEKAK